jgi:hypothetical protein
MKNPITGQVQPEVSKLDQEVSISKPRAYKSPDGVDFEITQEEFEQVVAIFDVLRRWRDEKTTQTDIEPEGSTTQEIKDPVLTRKVG